MESEEREELLDTLQRASLRVDLIKTVREAADSIDKLATQIRDAAFDLYSTGSEEDFRVNAGYTAVENEVCNIENATLLLRREMLRQLALDPGYEFQDVK